MNAQDFMAPVTAPAFETSHITEVLRARRDRLLPLLTQAVPGPGRSCTCITGSTGRVPVNTLVPGLLRLVPGLTVLDHGRARAGPHVLGIVRRAGCAGRRATGCLDAAELAGADTVVTIFHSCHREFVSLERGRPDPRGELGAPAGRGRGWAARGRIQAVAQRRRRPGGVGEARIEAAGEVAFARLTEPELRRPAVV